MPLTPGEKIGPYEILSAIGAGGMGEVYKARDTRLDRTVAVKVLPDHIAAREDVRARFEREARSVASLNHPNICSLFDIGPGYMVMELIEGETLASRIEKGALPLEQALKFAAQIADALDRAHRAGVTHRDVKPQNIMLTRDGVKVLDFGLAKSVSSKPGPTDETLTKVLTAEGTIMGTPQYMAPEQFAGKEADARSDIWAFGAVLYEMVTGRKAFQGANYQSLVGAILAMDPAPMAITPFTPTWLERLVRRCLEKDPEDRWQSMRDIVLELRRPPEERVAVAPAKASRWPWIAAAGACLALGTLAGGLWMRGGAGASRLPVMLEVNPPVGSHFSGIVDGGGSAISPDGRTLAFIAVNSKGETLLHLRQLASREVRALAGTEGAARPFWSPDSRSLGFVASAVVNSRTLKRIDVAGGLPVTLCTVRFARGGTWNRDGVILFGDNPGGLQRISAQDGSPVPVAGPVPGPVTVTKPQAHELHYYPQFLPDGQRFLYLSLAFDPATAARSGALFLGSLDGTAATRIVDTAYKALYDPASGKLLYMRAPGKLVARTLELDPPRLAGEPIPVAEGVGVTTSNRFADYSISHDGTLFFGQRNGAGQILQFGWRDRTGKLIETLGNPVAARLWFDLSPDNLRLVHYGNAGSDGSTDDLWVMDLATGLRSRLTFRNPRGAAWSPDGQSVLYVNLVDRTIQRKRADGAGEAEILFTGDEANGAVWDVSPDGQYVLYNDRDLMVLPLTGDRRPRRYLETKADRYAAAFAPDGRWVAYASNESGRSEIYVQGFPEPRSKWLVSAEGGGLPRWRADGREIYWVRPDGMLMAAGIELSPSSAKVGRAEPLFVVSDAGGSPNYRPARDGKRFLVLDPEKGAEVDPPMVVLQNWAAGLGK